MTEANNGNITFTAMTDNISPQQVISCPFYYIPKPGVFKTTVPP